MVKSEKKGSFTEFLWRRKYEAKCNVTSNVGHLWWQATAKTGQIRVFNSILIGHLSFQDKFGWININDLLHLKCLWLGMGKSDLNLIMTGGRWNGYWLSLLVGCDWLWKEPLNVFPLVKCSTLCGDSDGVVLHVGRISSCSPVWNREWAVEPVLMHTCNTCCRQIGVLEVWAEDFVLKMTGYALLPFCV